MLVILNFVKLRCICIARPSRFADKRNIIFEKGFDMSKQAIRYNKSSLFLSALSCLLLNACNSGSSTAPTNTLPAAGTLNTYINMLEYNGGEGVLSQQSFVVSAATILSSMSILFYSDGQCSRPVQNINMNGGVQLSTGVYTTTNQSNNFLCNQFVIPGYKGCDGLLQAVNAGQVKSMRFLYYYANASTDDASFSQCMYNASKGYEAPLNYTSTPAACTESGVCSLSQAYTYDLQPSAYKHLMFISDATYTGNLGGYSGADDKCNSDSNKPAAPSGVKYRALLDSNAATLNGINYYRISDNAIIAQATGANLVAYSDLINSISTSSEPVDVWTGGDGNVNCLQWTLDTAQAGDRGYGEQKDSLWYAGEVLSCTKPAHLYCVAQ
jgi:hypothetical protein